MTRQDVVTIDLGKVKNSSELHLKLSDALGFPGWYGQNWDAFWDATSGLVEMPAVLKIQGWISFSARHPEDARLMEQCLEDLAVRYPNLASVVAFD